jgi:uncharacterized membrane protein YphA (DoxX/SURF4 family)
MNSMKLSSLIRHPYFVAFSIQAVLAYEWISGGLGKMHEGQFVSTIGKTLGRFENGNPHDWYVGSVLRIAKNSPETFGQLVQWGELLAGIGLVVAILVYGLSKQSQYKNMARYVAILSLLGGAFMNGNFYYAAGWTSPSTGGLNVLMFWIEIVLFIAWIVLPKNQGRTTDNMRS